MISLLKRFNRKDYVKNLNPEILRLDDPKKSDGEIINSFLEKIRLEKGIVKSVQLVSNTYNYSDFEMRGRQDTLVGEIREYLIHYKCHEEISYLESEKEKDDKPTKKSPPKNL